MRKLITLRIPATSANLGPGFDCLGLALDLWNTFELYETSDAPGSVRVETIGEGAGLMPDDASNLIAQTLLGACEPNTGLHISSRCDIPCGSGLGSSSTAVLAGLICAAYLSSDAAARKDPSGLPRAVLPRAIAVEGHGDNVAPAVHGGLVVLSANGDPHDIVVPVATPALRAVVCVPEFRFLTQETRAALPAQYARKDVVFNTGRAMLVLTALQRGDLALLGEAVADRVHEPYRLPAIPGALRAISAARAAGAAAVCLSGAGPGLIAFAAQDHEAIGAAMRASFAEAGLTSRYWIASVTPMGAQVVAG